MLPLLKSKISQEEINIKTFGGINRLESIATGEVTDGQNLSSANYPALSSRKRRSLSCETEHIINGLGSFEGYIFTSYTPEEEHIFLNFDGTQYEYTDYTDSADFAQQRKFAALADSILIIPDNVIFFVKSRTFSKICVSDRQSDAEAYAKFKEESKGSNLFDDYTISYIATYVHNRISCRKITYNASGTRDFYFSKFDPTLKAGDIITLKMDVWTEKSEYDEAYISYIRKMKKGVTLKIKDITSVTYTAPSGTITQTSELIFDDNCIDTGGYRDLCIASFSLERGMPVLDEIYSFGNRIWAISSKDIYTSKLSDASEWNDFTVDDYGTLPYACFHTTAQTEGDFTAIASLDNYIYTFKENTLHKIYGDNPDEYILHTKKGRGVARGMSATLCLCRDSLVYAASDGIYRYAGDNPSKISECLGHNPQAICAAADGDRYYLLCKEDEQKKIMVYDLRRKLWHCEDAPNDIRFMTTSGDKVYMAGANKVICLNECISENEYERNISWHFTLRRDDRLSVKKGFGKLSIRYLLGKDASFTVYAVYADGSQSAVCGARHDEIPDGGYTVHLPIRRCMAFDLHFRGMGDFTLRSINIKYYRGSDI